MAVTTSEESLDRALRHVSEGWLPPQHSVLERIKQRFTDHEYERDRSQLVLDLKEDFSLYTYCLRELTAAQANQPWAVQQYQQAPLLKQNPVEMMESAELSTLQNILNKSEKDISRHSYAEINKLQALRFRETMISASTAEVLAESVHVDPEFGFACGMLRQLGLSLIAWNYPHVYSRAVETLTRENSLDFALKKVLGFSPSMLGVAFARKWNLCDDVLIALGDRKAIVTKSAFLSEKTKQDLVAENVGATLAKICEVGEALARANDPEHYPTALTDWDTANQIIAQQLGPQGIEVIYSRTQRYLRHYSEQTPELSEFVDIDAAKEQIGDSQFTSGLLEKNQFIRNLPSAVREDLRTLYGKFRPNKILKNNVRELMLEIAPKAGFVKGCFFMYDPEKRVLAPAIKFGEFPPERLRPVRVSSVLAQFDLVASAFSLKSPMREEIANQNGEPTTILVGAVGHSTKIGVLYVEADKDFAAAAGPDPMPIYRAIRQTLHDCLNLS